MIGKARKILGKDVSNHSRTVCFQTTGIRVELKGIFLGDLFHPGLGLVGHQGAVIQATRHGGLGYAGKLCQLNRSNGLHRYASLCIRM